LKRVYIAAFGSGMGHASRMSALAERLVASGERVEFSSSGEVTRWLRARGFQCNDVPLVDVVFTETGSFSATKTMGASPVLVGRSYKQLVSEVRNIERFSPDIVFSDSVVSTVLASRILGVRSVAILNQLRLISSPRTPKTAAQLISGGSITIFNAFWETCDSIMVPDLPPPYTISERNLWNAGSASARARYIGFLTPGGGPPRPEDAPIGWRKGNKKRVFWQVSGPPATRSTFVARAIQASNALKDKFIFLITAGDPGGKTEPEAIPGGYLYGWCNSSSVFVDSCDFVVSRAGHVSISDYILRAKPSLLSPIPSQTEQMGNAAKAEGLGVALSIPETELDPSKVEDCLGRLSQSDYRRRAEEMRSLAQGYDALGSLVELVAKA